MIRSLARWLPVALAVVSPAAASIISVPDDITTIQGAIEFASDGDTVLVSPGEHFGPVDFAGKAIVLRAAEGPLRTCITGAPDVTLVTFASGEDRRAVLDGFTLRGGWGAVHCENSAPTIRGNVMVGQQITNWAAVTLSGTMADSAAGVGPAGAAIVNNTILRCRGGGISSFSSETPLIHKNIIAGNGRYGIHRDTLFPETAPLDLDHNWVYGNAVALSGIVAAAGGIIEADPQLAPDHSPVPGSPCIVVGKAAPEDHIGALTVVETVLAVRMLRVGPPSPEADADTLRFASIQSALDAAGTGDLVEVEPGTYDGPLDFLGKDIILRSIAGPLETVITAAPEVTLVSFTGGETNEAVLEGFTLRGGWIGVYCSNAAPTIDHNILIGQHVHNWAAICLGTANADSSVSTCPAPAIISNNTIMNCRNGGISTFSTEAPRIYGNVIVDNGHYGLHKEGILPGVAEPRLHFNLIHGNKQVETYEITDFGTGYLAVDPKLADDGRLLPDSPCIDSGPGGTHYNDPDGSRNDRGAVPFLRSVLP